MQQILYFKVITSWEIYMWDYVIVAQKSKCNQNTGLENYQDAQISVLELPPDR